ncbi:hypothetical protein BP00DRAFT_421901 [Aspergillus indologenus CBS 114.80]|uniref:Uncharacterized protein n=1 Tax=Aspergillus indologenus CBS 114.80 TaxID=1450541 RepID=A0A2V5IKF2_9EURO|nr:hypothetical protein BP00DRAFT_421901 [Aspergillus indologenus CBS 114.80]
MVRPLETEEVTQRLRDALEKYTRSNINLIQESYIEPGLSLLNKTEFPTKQRRSEHRKAKRLLCDIYENGAFPVLLILFVLEIPSYQWFRVERKAVVPALKEWWKEVTVPRDWERSAVLLCTRHFDTLLRTGAERATNLDISLCDLFSLIGSGSESDASVQVIHNPGGSTLPYIKFNEQETVGISGSLELSVDLYSMLSRAQQPDPAAETSHPR